MQDFALTFETEAQAIAALPEYRTQSEDGEQWTGSIIPNATRWIQRPQYDPDGNIITPAETVPGWHCIIRAETCPSLDHLVTEPGDMEPVFAGGWKTAPIPEQVSRLQARLALIEVDLWDAVVAYFADPDRTPAEMAFWEDAQTWRRADPVIAAAGTALGLTAEQIDELFRNAANR